MQEEETLSAFTLTEQSMKELRKHFKFQFSEKKLRSKCLNFSIDYEWI